MSTPNPTIVARTAEVLLPGVIGSTIVTSDGHTETVIFQADKASPIGFTTEVHHDLPTKAGLARA